MNAAIKVGNMNMVVKACTGFVGRYQVYDPSGNRQVSVSLNDPAIQLAIKNEEALVQVSPEGCI